MSSSAPRPTAVSAPGRRSQCPRRVGGRAGAEAALSAPGGAGGNAVPVRGRDTAAMAEISPSAWRRFRSYSWRRRILALRHRAERLSPGYDEALRDRFRAEVVSRGTFGTDWFLGHVR